MNAALAALIKACITVFLGKDHNSLRRLALIVALLAAALLVWQMLPGCTMGLEVDGQARRLKTNPSLNFWPNNSQHPATPPEEISNDLKPSP